MGMAGAIRAGHAHNKMYAKVNIAGYVDYAAFFLVFWVLALDPRASVSIVRASAGDIRLPEV